MQILILDLVNNKDPLVRLVRRAQASVGRWSHPCQDGQEGEKGGVCRHGRLPQRQHRGREERMSMGD